MTNSTTEGAPLVTSLNPVYGADALPRRPQVLVVDDHDLGRKSLGLLLESVGYEVITAKDGHSALEAMDATSTIDYVLTDLRLPDIDGREVVQAARERVPAARIALITGWDVADEESDRLGIDWVFLKPLDVPHIVAKLRQCPADRAQAGR